MTRAWQRMLSGRRLDLLDPSPLDIEIEDIAHGLARVARWNGQTEGDNAFSVAQHSVLVEAIFSHQQKSASPKTKLVCLLHDAAEYVIGDMISPFKAALGGDYKVIELRIMGAVHLRFDLSSALNANVECEIKQADQVAAYLEATQLAGFDHTEAGELFGRPRGLAGAGFKQFLSLQPLKPIQAAASFLQRFEALI